MVSRSRMSKEALAAIKKAAQQKRLADGLPAAAAEDIEHEALRAQVPLTMAGKAKAALREARLRKAGTLASTVVTEAEIEAARKK